LLIASAAAVWATSSVVRADVAGFTSFAPVNSNALGNGIGYANNNTTFETTDGNGGEATSGFSTALQDVSSFTTTFVVTANGSADGGAFVIQTGNPALVGGAGGSGGYQGIAGNSAAFEWEYYGGPQLGVSTNGAAPDYSQVYVVDNQFNAIQISTGDPIQYTLSYQGNNTLNVTMVDQSTQQILESFSTNNFTSPVSGFTLPGAKAYVGFTGGTGGAASTQSISSFGFAGGSSKFLPIAGTGFNQSIVIPANGNTSGITATMDNGTGLGGNTWYETGYQGQSTGLPASGSTFTSQQDSQHVFKMQSYSGNSAFLLDTGETSQTFTLTNPANYGAISFLTATGNGPGLFQVVVNYSDGAPSSTSYDVVSPDWFSDTPSAWQANGRSDLNGDLDSVNSGNPNLYQEDLAISDNSDPISSITLNYLSGGEVAILALSGQAGAPTFTYTGATTAGAFDTTTANFNAGGVAASTAFVNGSEVVFSDTATDSVHNITVAPGVQVSNMTVYTAGQYTFGGAGIGGTGGLVVNGTGTVTLNNSNTFTGDTAVTAGTLIVGSTGALASANVTVGSGATLTINQGGALTSNNLNLTVAGTFNDNNPTLTVGTLNGGGGISLNGTALTVTQGGTFAGQISDGAAAGSLKVNLPANGILTLAGTSTYSGGTTLTSGTLYPLTPNALGTGSVHLHGGTLGLVGPANYTYSNFAGYQVNRSGQSNPGSISSDNSTLYLTDGNSNEAVSAYSPKPVPVSTAASFTASFTWHNANAGTSNDGVYSVADGFAFNLLSSTYDSNTALGSNGGGLGYAGVGHSLSVQFDTYSGYDSGFGTALNTNGTQQTGGTYNSISPISIQAENLGVTLTYNGAAQTLTESLVGLDPNNNNQPDGNTFSTTYNNVDVTSILGGASSAYIGFSGGSGGVGLNDWITNFSFQTLNPIGGPGAIVNPVTAAGGTTSTIEVSVSPGLSQASIGALTLLSDPVLGGSTVVLATTNGSSGHAVLVVPSLSISNNASGAYTSKLDIGTNDLDLPGASLSLITAMVKQGYANGAWTGNGITSSAAAADSAHLTAVGVIDNDNPLHPGTPLYGTNGGISSTFDGATPNDGDILVTYTYYGDCNLDGAVDGSDYAIVDSTYLSENFSNGVPHNPVGGWYFGDFNYDGVVDGSDYTLLDNAFNQQGSSLGVNPAALLASATAEIAGGTGGGTAVPEPATLSMFGVAAAGLLARRRRHQQRKI
jgi:autotransporter-associated beta strand protein